MPRRIQPCWHWCDGSLLRIPESLNDVTSEWITGAFRCCRPSCGRDCNRERDNTDRRRARLCLASRPRSPRVRFVPPVYFRRRWSRSSLLPGSTTPGINCARKSTPREWLFYSHLGPDAGVVPPVCYFSAHDPVSRRIVLLLEDLGGARFGDSATAWSRRDAEIVVDALAGLSAGSWNNQELAQ